MLDHTMTNGTVSGIADAIRAGRVSAVEATDAALTAIDRLDPLLHAFLTVDHDGAREAAASADRAVAAGAPLGPLHGVPIAVKDLEDTAGLRSTYGAASYTDNVPTVDSALVARLRAAGAVIVGKTNTPAFGLLGETKNRLAADGRNPWNTDRTTGGSSGGSAAAVAAGMVAAATGTDSAGSINCPAAMCGVYGIKPTHGRVPMHPDYGDALHFNDGGPLTRSVADAARLLTAMAGPDPRDPVSLREPPPDFARAATAELGRVRIAWSADVGHFAVDREVVAVAEAAARAFAELGCEPVAETPDVPDPWRSYTPLYVTDVRVALGEWLSEHRVELYEETVDELAAVPPLSAEDYVRAYHELLVFRARMSDFFERYELLLTPATAVAPFPVGEPPATIGGRSVRAGWQSFMPFQIMWNMTGQPCASVPAGLTADGLPVGLMIVAARGREDLVLGASAAFERLRPWADRWPPLLGA
ncbi:MAG TPA: amidase [Solirubrobacteraceae bacterium]|jgi:Asp-tRNA(Asn)/Glu-tRNA(Gln) amidotransferase A subunit family amidase|nr:amidase [Solirubrobacteraceae bacterium]